jgi:farnesyl-diphosphate farnesyltransferase
MDHRAELMRVLQETSRTFFLPIKRLPEKLQDAIGGAYLCMRAIDEIEDHPLLNNTQKASLLRGMSTTLQARLGTTNGEEWSSLSSLFSSCKVAIPEVTMRMGTWLDLVPAGIAPRVWDATIAMADRMAFWAEKNWLIETEDDLDGYTYSVAGAVGLLLCDIWAWFDGSQFDRVAAIHFGRGLQSVNILRNRREDIRRGVDFYPTDWKDGQMFAYSWKILNLAKKGMVGL